MLCFRSRHTPAQTKPTEARSDQVAGSGTVEISAWKPKVLLGEPSALLDVKLQVAGVASNPFPTSVPAPVMLRKLGVWVTTIDDARSNVNPSKVNRGDGLKTQGDPIIPASP
jgi:hypothetical protein